MKTDELGFVRAAANDGIHGEDIAVNTLEGGMKRIYRRIKRRLAYLAKDSDERAVLIADIALALAAAAFGAAAMYAALN
jgi:hypothetical protein